MWSRVVRYRFVVAWQVLPVHASGCVHASTFLPRSQSRLGPCSRPRGLRWTTIRSLRRLFFSLPISIPPHLPRSKHVTNAPHRLIAEDAAGTTAAVAGTAAAGTAAAAAGTTAAARNAPEPAVSGEKEGYKVDPSPGQAADAVGGAAAPTDAQPATTTTTTPATAAVAGADKAAAAHPTAPPAQAKKGGLFSCCSGNNID